MVLIDILLGLVIAFGLSASWWFPLGLIIRDRITSPDRRLRPWCIWHLTLSLWLIGFSFVVFSSGFAVATIIVPWFGIALVTDIFLLGLTHSPWSLVVAGVIFMAFAGTDLWITRRARVIIFTLAFVASGLGGYTHAEYQSKTKMHNVAKALDLDINWRRTVLASLRHHSSFFNFESHASGQRDGRYYRWSYELKSFY